MNICLSIEKRGFRINNQLEKNSDKIILIDWLYRRRRLPASFGEVFDTSPFELDIDTTHCKHCPVLGLCFVRIAGKIDAFWPFLSEIPGWVEVSWYEIKGCQGLSAATTSWRCTVFTRIGGLAVLYWNLSTFCWGIIETSQTPYCCASLSGSSSESRSEQALSTAVRTCIRQQRAIWRFSRLTTTFGWILIGKSVASATSLAAVSSTASHQWGTSCRRCEKFSRWFAVLGKWEKTLRSCRVCWADPRSR